MQKFAGVAQETNEAARAQAEALSQIEQGIEQISGVTQNTAALHRRVQLSANSLRREQESWISLLINLSFIDRLIIRVVVSIL